MAKDMPQGCDYSHDAVYSWTAVLPMLTVQNMHVLGHMHKLKWHLPVSHMYNLCDLCLNICLYCKADYMQTVLEHMSVLQS